MNNSLLTKLTNHGLNMMSDQIREKSTLFALIGSRNSDDRDLIAALDDNDLNNNITYGFLSNRNWIGYENVIKNSYYDKNNFLTFDINIPSEIDLNMYVYGIAIIDSSDYTKKLISITRSPSIFNKVKNTSSTFSIKMTFGQEDINSQFRDNIHDSIFQDNKFISLFSGSANNNIITLDSSSNGTILDIGTRIKGDNIEDNTVIVDNAITDANLNSNQFRISKPLRLDTTNSALFKINTFYSQDDFITRGEFNQWQENHNHNKDYYKINETVKNSLQLNGYESSHYASIFDLNDIKEDLNNKLSISGGKLLGSLQLQLGKNKEFKEDEVLPNIEIKNLISNSKEFVINELIPEAKQEIYDNTGRKGSLITVKRDNIVSAINELAGYIGNINQLYSNGNSSDLSTQLKKLKDQIGEIKTFNNGSVTEAINLLERDKVPNNGAVFRDTPTINEKINYSKPENRKKVTTVEIVNEMISNQLEKSSEINLLSLQTTKYYPIIFNEANEMSYTDSIIYTERNSNNNGVMRLEIKGNGSAGGRYAPSLKLYHSVYGRDKVVGKVEMFFNSSALVVWLKGGLNYKLIQNSFKEPSPIIVGLKNLNSYKLLGTSIILSPVEVSSVGNGNKMQTGFWMFNDLEQITIDYSVNPHISNSTI